MQQPTPAELRGRLQDLQRLREEKVRITKKEGELKRQVAEILHLHNKRGVDGICYLSSRVAAKPVNSAMLERCWESIREAQPESSRAVVDQTAEVFEAVVQKERLKRAGPPKESLCFVKKKKPKADGASSADYFYWPETPSGTAD